MKNVPARSDAGQAAPLLAAVMAVLAVLVLALGQLGQRVVDAARARTAADAAALAGAAAGRAAAATMAAENGGTLVAYSDTGGDVRVTVRVDGASATARAAMVADDAPAQAGQAQRARAARDRRLTPVAGYSAGDGTEQPGRRRDRGR